MLRLTVDPRTLLSRNNIITMQISRQNHNHSQAHGVQGVVFHVTEKRNWNAGATFFCKTSRVLCNVEYPSETHLKLESHEILFDHKSHFNNQIILKFCTAHDSITVVLCTKFQNNWTTQTYVMDERNFARFEFKMSSRQISYILHSTPGASFTNVI